MNNLVPVAQYLRKSTDHQQYSLENQADVIARYAMEHNFQIVKTYSDPARSGLHLKNRPSLKRLLGDVVCGRFPFRAILVYDVTRWGRFQDADESAHYEYLCKLSGAPVHYCAEMFPNDGSISALLMKALKRGMAGEYSRELSVKVRAGLFRLARMGYKLGGHAPYGLRRQLLDSQGRPKQILADGERKSVTNERVVLVPGTPEEVAVVQRIFQEFVNDHRSLRSIADRLNRDGIPFLGGRRWCAGTIIRVLTRSQYAGTQVWGRTAAFLSSPAIQLPRDRWAVCDKAFTAIIDEETFSKAQDALANMPWRLNNDEILDRLRRVLKEHGKLDARIIEQSPLCPGARVYFHRFGGLLNAYARVGYTSPQSTQITARQKAILVRRDLIAHFVEALPDTLEEFRPGQHRRELLKQRKTGRLISLLICRYRPTLIGESRWLVEIPGDARKRTTLLALMDEENKSIKEMRLFSALRHRGGRFYIYAESEWLRSGLLLEQTTDLPNLLKQLPRLKKSRSCHSRR